jgi:hypothetical protein
LLSGAIVDGELDLAKGTFAESLDNLVGAYALLRLDPFLEFAWTRWDMLLLLGRLRRDLLLWSSDVGRGERYGELLVLEASRDHDGWAERGRGRGRGPRPRPGMVKTVGYLSMGESER